MRIALFTETYLPHINGVVTHVKILRDGLVQLGHEVLVVTADAGARQHYVEDGILHCPAHTSRRLTTSKTPTTSHTPECISPTQDTTTIPS